MNNSNGQFGTSAFTLKHQGRDFFRSRQENPERIGDVGKLSEEYVKNARTKFNDDKFHDLAKDPGKFVDPETAELYGIEHDYNHMNYDAVERDDGKGQNEVMEDIEPMDEDGYGEDVMDALRVWGKVIDPSIKRIKGVMKTPKYDINTTASAIGSMPISQDDYT